VTIYGWGQTFTPEFIDAAPAAGHVPGRRWFVDETYVKIAGRWHYRYRAVDRHGQVAFRCPSVDECVSGVMRSHEALTVECV
jgi:transposase-like protein